MVRLVDRYMSRLEEAGDTPELALILYHYSTALNIGCRFRAGEGFAKRSLEMARRIGDRRAIIYARQSVLHCSVVLARHTLEIAERESAELIAESTGINDNYALNWAHFQIGWDYMYRGLMREAKEWAWKLMDLGRQRGDPRAIGMAHMQLACISLVAGQYDEAARNADECLRTATTPFDRKVAAGMGASAAIFRGDTTQGLAELLRLRREALESGFTYPANGMVGAAAAGLVLSGQIGQGIRLLRDAIASADSYGDRTTATWNRLFLAEIFLEMLGSQTVPPLSVIFRNLAAIINIKLFGRRRVAVLLEEAGRHPQLHEQGTIRARINMDLGLLYKVEKKPALAREYLEKARGPAELQGAASMVSKIEAALAGLR
jgi:tetratricopeptide (TPR) repeat protein